ncbi:hypothetical protein N7535_003547 [Penicillium sp. DV-2018c]|nr:hypothetical protein N7535_003547 [Penicillium sp. DV-2018c]
MAPKRKHDEVIAELPSQEEVGTRTELLRPCSRRPRLQLPSGLNVHGAYTLFSLFFTDDIFEHISRSTNEYARLKRGGGADESESPGTASRGRRPWQDTTAADIKVFVGILIYIGANPLPEERNYWHQGSFQRRSFRPQLLGSTTIQGSVDETMVRCFGRSKHTVKMPNKPIKQGYKLFALAKHGYIWTFTWSSRQNDFVDFYRSPGLTPTGSMVLDMVCKLPGLSSGEAVPPTANAGADEALYNIYFDNYFSTVALSRPCETCDVAQLALPVGKGESPLSSSS